jgi:uncharacterized membrane protein
VSASFIPDFSAIPALLLPAVHGGGDGAAGGGLLGLLDSLLEGLTRLSDGGGGPVQIMPGIFALGSNLHPVIVHFPIALLTVFYCLDIVGALSHRQTLRQTASLMLYCGTVGAVLAAAAGLYAASIVPHGEVVHEIMEWHGRFGLTVAGLAVVLAIWRGFSRNITGMALGLHWFLATVMMVCLLLGGDLGGAMVYEHGVAVHNLQTTTGPHQHAADPGVKSAKESPKP